MKGSIASVMRKCVRRGGNVHAFEKAGIGHAVSDHTGGIGFPGRENELLHGTDCFLTMRTAGQNLTIIGSLHCRLWIGNIQPFFLAANG